MTSLSPQLSPAPSPPESKAPPGRRTSFGFLHRSKSKERLRDRKVSGGKISKRNRDQTREDELSTLQEANSTPRSIPKLPILTPSPQLQTFGGEQSMLNDNALNRGNETMEARTPTVPVPQEPRESQSPEAMDAFGTTESMTHRGRYSYAASASSSIESPRQVRRRKDPTPYNILVIGARNAGKTSFLNFLRMSLASKKRPKRPAEERGPPPAAKASPNFAHHYLETEFEGERVGLTLWDSQGLDKTVVDLQLREMSSFIQSKFEDTFSEERKVFRAPGVRDTHIHCVFLILDPVRLDANIQAAQQQTSADKSARKHNVPAKVGGALDDDFDIQVLRTLQGKTSVVPVISKADTITTGHMTFLKERVRESLKKAGLDPLEALSFDADEEPEEDRNGIIDKFDERDEDEENAKTHTDSADSEDGRGSPHTSDSETVPQDQPTPAVPRRSSQRRKPVGTDGDSEDGVPDGPFLPYSVLSPDPYSLHSGDGLVGRKFPWGFADPYNPEHCDFMRLKESCFGEWRAELRAASKEIWYERWRTSRLNRQGIGANGTGVGARNGAGTGQGERR